MKFLVKENIQPVNVLIQRVNQYMKSEDQKGNLVHVADRVKVLSIDPLYIAGLPEDERELVGSMIGEIFRVEKIEHAKYMYISRRWHLAGGLHQYHSICLSPDEVELINTK